MPTATQRPPSHLPQAASPPDSGATKNDLTTWWRQFKRNTRKPKEEEKPETTTTAGGIFGVPLDVSIKYANVAISQIDDNGQSYLYGYVPIIVAKCGVYLKEKAIDVEGIFRLAGAERRIKELMTIFSAPDRYGRGLDWTGYTVHDAANLLRRYLNQLPEPIIPLAMYSKFREPLRHHQAQAVGPMEQQLEEQGDFDSDATIVIFQQLITKLPPLNRQLLLYILDLLAVFSSKSDVNRMTAPNLSAIFQPGLLRHPDHDLAPAEYRLSQDVVIFLIEHQEHFVIGLPGTAADEKTIQDMQTASKAAASTPTTPKTRTQQLLGRSASSASAGSDKHKYGSIRRNASTNSRGSRQSQHTPSPVTPPVGSPFIPGSKGSGVHRSNTVPSKKSPSPALSGSERFQRFHPAEPLTTVTPGTPVSPSPLASSNDQAHTPSPEDRLGVHSRSPLDFKKAASPSPNRSPLLKPFASEYRSVSQDRISAKSANSDVPAVEQAAIGGVSPAGTPTRERGLSSLWKQSPSDTERKEPPRRKLQKKRPPGELSAQGSYPSINAGSNPTSPALAATSVAPVSGLDGDPEQLNLAIRPGLSTNNSFQTAREHVVPSPQVTEAPAIERDSSTATLRPPQMALKDLPGYQSGSRIKVRNESPAGSSTSRSTGAGESGLSTGEDDGEGLEVAQKEKKHRWRISMSRKKAEEKSNGESIQATSTLDSHADADRSASSVGSSGRMPRKSFTDESNQSASVRAPSSSEAEDRATSPRRGPLGWIRGKMQDRRDRAKSPSARAPTAEQTASSQSLNAIAATETSQQPVHSQQAPISTSREDLRAVSTTSSEAPVPAQTAIPQISTSDLASPESVPDTSEAVTPKAPQQPMLSAFEAKPEETTASGEAQEVHEEPK